MRRPRHGKRLPLRSAPPPVVPGPGPPLPVRKRRLLDVGSCYNPLLYSPYSSDLNIIAIDLFPADSSVFQADFSNVTIGEVNK
jgi:hypothetical protein